MGTGVGTESGAEGGSRGDLSRESQRERARGRGGSAPGRPDLSGLTSFFLSLSFFPPLCLPVPSPMAKPCGLAPPLFLRYLALSLSLSLSLSPKLGCGVGMCRGVAAAAVSRVAWRGGRRPGGGAVGVGEGGAGSGAAEELSPG